jgi:hypothetical protein
MHHNGGMCLQLTNSPTGVPLRVAASSNKRAGKPLWLTVNVKNSRAIAFYTKHGYSKIGVTYFRLGGESHENHVLLGSDA